LFNNKMINKISLTSKIFNVVKKSLLKHISWIINNFIKNNINNYLLPLQINNKYQIVASYGLIKFGMPKSIILLILLCL
jgi:hypothetical protein